MKRERSSSPTKEPATKKPRSEKTTEVVAEEEKQSSDVSGGEDRAEENSTEMVPEVCEQKQMSCEDVSQVRHHCCSFLRQFSFLQDPGTAKANRSHRAAR